MTVDTHLKVTGLNKRFGDGFGVSDVDLVVGADEIVALLGPSGCGKTTVLRCIAGVETPDSGEITIGGEVVQGEGISKPPEKRNLGMVYQNYAIWPHKTVYENVVFPLKYTDHPIPRAEYHERVERVLELVEIPALIDEPATNLSGGQQQRTALARSLVHDPDLLLLDEPLSNLDKELRTSMRHKLQQLQHELGVCMLYVTHDQEEAFYLSDRILIMRDGEILESGTPRELYSRPGSLFTRQFVGGRNRFEGTIDRNGGDPVVRTELADFPLGHVDYISNGTDSGTVSCFLRPDEISLGQFATDGEGIIELHGVVVAEGLIGDEYEISVLCDETDRELVVHTEQYQELQRGDEIHLHVQPRTIQVYSNSQ